MPDPPTILFRNTARRPVEIYVGENPTVLLPGEAVELPADDPHCAVLEQRGVLVRLPPPAPTVPPPPRASSAPRRSAAASAPTASKATVSKTADQVPAKKAASKKTTARRANPEDGERS